MNVAKCLTLVAVLLLARESLAQEKDPPKKHPFAPSLPLLSQEEYAKIDKVIDRFILYDSGQLPGADGKKILADFEALGPEAIPRLIMGFNRAARLKASCPAVIIARKLRRLLGASYDGQLLDFARMSIGGSDVAARHRETVSDLKLAIMQRKSFLQRTGQLLDPSGRKTPPKMTTAELIQASGSERGAALTRVLIELETREGEKVIDALGAATAAYEKDIKQLAQYLLAKHLNRQRPDVLKKCLQSPRDAVRAMAAQVVGGRGLLLGQELIELLKDESAEVRQAARQALVRLSRGQDFGPEPNSTAEERDRAIAQWQRWWKGRTAGR